MITSNGKTNKIQQNYNLPLTLPSAFGWLGIFILLQIPVAIIIAIFCAIWVRTSGLGVEAIEKSTVVGVEIAQIFLVIFVAYLIKSRRSLNAVLGLNRLSIRSFLLWIVAGLLLFWVFELAEMGLSALSPTLKMMVLENNEAVFEMVKGFSLFSIFIMLVVAAPLVEEFFFRGVFFASLQAKYGVWPTIFLTTIIWALLHVQYNIIGIGTIFVMGIILGWVRYRTGSIYVPFILHFINNGLCMVEVLAKGVI